MIRRSSRNIYGKFITGLRQDTGNPSATPDVSGRQPADITRNSDADHNEHPVIPAEVPSIAAEAPIASSLPPVINASAAAPGDEGEYVLIPILVIHKCWIIRKT